MYIVAKPYLPEEALFVIRYHSFYAAHDKGAYIIDGFTNHDAVLHNSHSDLFK